MNAFSALIRALLSAISASANRAWRIMACAALMGEQVLPKGLSL